MSGWGGMDDLPADDRPARSRHAAAVPASALDRGADLGVLMTITDEEFQGIRKIVYDNFGINLTDQKKSLVVGRLQKLLRQMGFTTFRQYYDYVVGNPEALNELVNRISTNHTFFYRENEHFKFMREKALPELVRDHLARHDKDLRIWCAAASSGEEPYTIMVSLLEHFGRDYDQWDVGLLATDISETALTQAVTGVYPVDRMQLVPEGVRQKYFRELPDGQWAVADRLKKEITYRRFNLMNKSFPFRKQFDLIFCRNVMIYFDQTTRDELVHKLYDFTVPGGYLFIGHSETLGRDRTPWRYVMPAVYRKEK